MNKTTATLTIIAIALVLGGVLSFFRNQTRPEAPAAPPAQQLSSSAQASERRTSTTQHQEFVSSPQESPHHPLPPPPLGALSGEITLSYPDVQSAAEAMERLQRAGFTIIAQSPALHALRVRVSGDKARRLLADLAGDTARPGYNFPVTLPTLPGESYQGPAGLPFGPNAIHWMGADGHPNLGQGVTIAVVDSGVAPHPNLQHALIGEIDLIGSSQSYGHGTAVASLIAGNTPDAPGIAPSADILSVRVLNHEGATDAFTLAQAIVAAADAGAHIINLSLGSYGDATVLRQAVSYAESLGSVLVASTGNDGIGLLAYPAAYPGVVAVGAIDAAGQRAGFSNYGEGIAITAPGVGIHAAWDDDALVSFSGTSAAAPLISGALAALLSENPGMTPSQAVSIMSATANDTGPPGPDSYTGQGSANLRRMLNHNTPGIHDLAIADHYIRHDVTRDDAISVLVTVQNRGTTWVDGTHLTVNYEGRQQHFMIEGLNPGQTTAREILLNPTPILQGQGTRITSQVSLTSAEDTNPSDNTHTTVLSRPPQ